MELTRKCNKCGETKPHSLMVRTYGDSGYKDNIKPLCRVCKGIASTAYKARVRQMRDNPDMVVPVVPKKNPNIMMPVVSKKNTMSQEQLKSCGLTGYRGPRVRDPNEALPPRTSKMLGVFKPPVWQTRQGSDLSGIRSVGMPT
jgi:hypothetical protein